MTSYQYVKAQLGLPAVQNDRQLYEDFKAQQALLRQRYAGANSKNDASKMHYGTDNSKFSVYVDRSPDFKPMENKKNIYERKLTRHQMPKTRDRFIANALTQLLAPDITKTGEEKKKLVEERYHHDKLKISDIPGTNVNLHGKKKMIQGRDYMD